MKLDFLQTLVASPLSRRDFAKKMGLTAGGLVGASMLGSTLLGGAIESARAQTSPSRSAAIYTDADILNFALNLEYLEAEFYLFATTGQGLVHDGVVPSGDTTGPTTGGKMVPGIAKSWVAYITTELRKDEVSHVKFLRSALGSAAAKKPTIKLDALGIGFNNLNEFLTLARAFEDVGQSAYAGAAGLISNKTYSEAAARILATEAQHSGAIRTHCIDKGLKVTPVDSVDIVPTPQTPFNNDQYGLTIARTPSQVLHIVYGGGTGKGGFYPDGMNGNIK